MGRIVRKLERIVISILTFLTVSFIVQNLLIYTLLSIELLNVLLEELLFIVIPSELIYFLSRRKLLSIVVPFSVWSLCHLLNMFCGFGVMYSICQCLLALSNLAVAVVLYFLGVSIDEIIVAHLVFHLLWDLFL